MKTVDKEIIKKCDEIIESLKTMDLEELLKAKKENIELKEKIKKYEIIMQKNYIIPKTAIKCVSCNIFLLVDDFSKEYCSECGHDLFVSEIL